MFRGGGSQGGGACVEDAGQHEGSIPTNSSAPSPSYRPRHSAGMRRSCGAPPGSSARLRFVRKYDGQQLKYLASSASSSSLKTPANSVAVCPPPPLLCQGPMVFLFHSLTLSLSLSKDTLPGGHQEECTISIAGRRAGFRSRISLLELEVKVEADSSYLI